jgi:hypothetical protein
MPTRTRSITIQWGPQVPLKKRKPIVGQEQHRAQAGTLLNDWETKMERSLRVQTALLRVPFIIWGLLQPRRLLSYLTPICWLWATPPHNLQRASHWPHFWATTTRSRRACNQHPWRGFISIMPSKNMHSRHHSWRYRQARTWSTSWT